jgi:MraZ protein
MFRGLHALNVDVKGRFKIPVRHQQNCATKLILSIHPDDACLLLYPLKEWQILEQKISNLPALNPHTKRLKRKLIGHANECELDKTLRLLIPPVLRTYAQIDKEIILSGQGHNFEIWNEQIWDKQLKTLNTLSEQTPVPIEVAQLTL